MLKQICNVLLVEDNQLQSKLIKNLLQNRKPGSLAEGFSFQVTWVKTLREALEELGKNNFNVVLLDLTLPDSKGLDTLKELLKQCSTIPIVVQTGTEEESLVVQALQLGAYGFLPKRNLDSNLLVYGIHLALERHLQVAKLQASKQQEEQQMELLLLEQFAATGTTNITARLYGTSTLRESLSDIFHEQVDTYSQLMDLALEAQTYKVEHNISEKLRNQAEKLGVLKAGPRDVVDIHTTALRQKTESATLAKAQAYVNEGRLMVLEMMGYLTAYYRKFYLGLSNMTIYKHTGNLKQDS